MLLVVDVKQRSAIFVLSQFHSDSVLSLIPDPHKQNRILSQKRSLDYSNPAELLVFLHLIAFIGPRLILMTSAVVDKVTEKTRALILREGIRGFVPTSVRTWPKILAQRAGHDLVARDAEAGRSDAVGRRGAA
jgi:hypothetical protein